MKKHTILSVILLMACGLYSDINRAQGGGFHGHRGFGFYFGVPFYGYPYYGNSYYSYPYYGNSYYGNSYYYPPTVQQPPSGYWYYCTYPEGYYPYITDCPNGWQQVEPTPPPPR